jgi:DNA (cytosine-5)-methyltransferase 1
VDPEGRHTCPACGATWSRLQKRGFYRTAFQRWRCQDCGKWSQSPAPGPRAVVPPLPAGAPPPPLHLFSPVLLDLFCSSGGATRGYGRAGFRTAGVDCRPQPRYPSEFTQADALGVLRRLLGGGAVLGYRLADIDAIHASPPCQSFSSLAVARGDGTQHRYPDLIGQTRDLLAATGKLTVLENITRAPMADTAVLLCGTQFGGSYMWHRKFECNFPVPHLECDHAPDTTYASPFTMPAFNRIKNDFGSPPGPEARYRLMKGITWTRNQKEGREALPPAYTEYVGVHLAQALAGHTWRHVA